MVLRSSRATTLVWFLARTLSFGRFAVPVPWPMPQKEKKKKDELDARHGVSKWFRCRRAQQQSSGHFSNRKNRVYATRKSTKPRTNKRNDIGANRTPHHNPSEAMWCDGIPSNRNPKPVQKTRSNIKALYKKRSMFASRKSQGSVQRTLRHFPCSARWNSHCCVAACCSCTLANVYAIRYAFVCDAAGQMNERPFCEQMVFVFVADGVPQICSF